jgi:hypothetical protein
MKPILVVALSLALAAQLAPNFSGRWVIQGGGRRGGGPTLTLNQVGNEVTGELAGGGGGGGGSAAPINNEIYDGKVENGTLSFYVWRGTDQPYKTMYKGTLNAAGDEIAFTVTGAPARGGAPGAPAAPQTITAKRVK